MTPLQGDDCQFAESAPPQFGGEIPKPPSTWPTVIGIIFIVVGSLGILMAACGGVINLATPQIMSQTGGQSNAYMTAQADLSRKYTAFTLSDATVRVALGIVLLVAGVGLLKNMRSSVWLSKGWAIARIIWAMPATVVGYLMMVDMFKVMQDATAQSSQRMPGGFNAIMQSLGVVGLVIGLIFACAIPAFALIWFSRRKIRAEIETWP